MLSFNTLLTLNTTEYHKLQEIDYNDRNKGRNDFHIVLW